MSVMELQQKLERMESLLSKLAPGADIQDLVEHARPKSSFSNSAFNSTPSPRADDYGSADEEGEEEVSEEEIIFVEPAVDSMVNGLNDLNISSTRFFGKSSGIHGVRRAMNIDACPLIDGASATASETPRTALRFKRPEIWTCHSWEDDSDTPTRWRHNGQYVFPDEDLLSSLIDLYFTSVNIYQPLLHRPTFLSNVASNLHRRDRIFGAVVLLVCALGSRFSNDPRVVLEGSNTPYSAGHKWYRQVEAVQNTSLTSTMTLHEMQMNCLLLMYSQWTGKPQTCWNHIGLVMRRAQDIGIHRKSRYRGIVNPVEEEQWKRAFWILVVQDRHMCSALGRPLAIYDDDFDLDLPTECDDEYWIADDPEQCFKQPPGKLSTVTAFNMIIKLHQILALALRTIYAVNKSSTNVMFRMMGQNWEQRMVAELDSALNQWFDSIPDELRFDTSSRGSLFFDISTMLYMAYYHVQILIHRPFITPAKKNAALAFPSLVICMNAARAGSRVIARHFQRSRTILPFVPVRCSKCLLLV